ncbi:hypothetical protein [Streptacidiphilus sp. PAMC 29251]
MDDNVDKALADGLGAEAAKALSAWARVNNRHYRLVRWLVNGRSRAPVAVVQETDLHESRSTNLVLKVPMVEEGALHRIEYARHREAILRSPEFAAKHLSTTVHEPFEAGGGAWITFQRIAGKTFEDSEVLTVLLRRMLHQDEAVDPAGAEPFTFAPGAFSAACGRVVAGVLRDWAKYPYVPRDEPLSVAEFLGLHLTDQLEQGGRLHPYALRYQGDEIHPEGEERPLPNPFAVAQGRYFVAQGTIRPLLGKTHGDLHTDNALVRVRPTVDIDDFHLIDNALYEGLGPLTRDPVHLVLYIIARTLETISPSQQRALIDLLLDPRADSGQLLPGWLASVVKEIDDQCHRWIEESSLAGEWREQTLLSYVACALMFVGRTSIRDEDRDWFIRLAARAAQKFADARPDALRAVALAAPQDLPAGSGRTGWIGRLCHDLPEVVEAAATEAAHDCPEALEELDGLRTAALGGLDRSLEYREFVRRIGGPDPDIRFGTEGSEGRPVDRETYVCPLELCDRKDRRAPGGPLPTCHLPRTDPQRMTASFR